MANQSFDLKFLCNLARLPLPDSIAGEQKLLTGLQQTLDFFQIVDAVETANVEPLFQPILPESGAERIDELVKGLDREAALANTPETDGQHFLVPQVLK